jgi:hypothetical protein
MMRLKKLIRSCLPLLLAVTLLAGAAQAALLDLGPVVPQVIGATAPVGHGFPSWYRDANRVPLEPCMNEAMCFFANPSPPLPISFPTNIPPELFYWAGDADIPLASGGKALLVQAIEAGYAAGAPAPNDQITFARIRIRVDTNVAGAYTVTTPFKQFNFNVTDIAAGINFTEDIGIAPGVFTGVLAGSIGPYLYCTDAPFPATDGSGGLYIGKNALACPVLGSTFTDPVTNQPANLFRVQGPAGFGGAPSGLVQTADFRVQGKIYEAVTPTPLTVDKAAYALDATGLRLSVFATTQPLSNQTGAGAFPLNFALNSTPSVLQLSATGLTTQTMTTNTPADGKFFATSGPVAAALPATVTVTNTADVPVTVQPAPLVDEVVISAATYNPLTKVLAITASSSDKVNAPALQAFMPGITTPLGTLAAGVLNVTLPVTAIPTNTITVTSAKGGSATAPVSTFALPAPPLVIATATLANGIIGTVYSQTLAATGGIGPYRWTVAVGSTLPAGLTLSTAGVLSGTPTAVGTITFGLQVTDSQAPAVTTVKAFTVVVSSAPATGVTLTSVPVSPQATGTAITFTAAATGGDAGPYEYSFWWRPSTTTAYTLGRTWSTTPTWNWNTAALGLPLGSYTVRINVRHVGSSVAFETFNLLSYNLTAAAPGVGLTPSAASPQLTGTAITFTAAAFGGVAGPSEYSFWWRPSGSTTYTLGRTWGTTPTWTWNTLGLPIGSYVVRVNARHVGTTVPFEAFNALTFGLN